jgi:hypothetical protein
MGLLGSFSPRGKRRTIYISDPSSIAMRILPDPTGEKDIRDWVDDVADAGVDLLIQEAYTQGWTTYWRSEEFEYDARPQHRRFLPLLDRGIQPLEVLLDQSRRRGMEFLAGIRMNDNHAHVSINQGVGAGASFLLDHPEWLMTETPPGDYYQLSTPMDYSFPEVRDYVYRVIEELLDRFDVDGIELCFRDQQYFPYKKGAECQHLMTEHVARIRKLVKKVGRQRKKKLILGARVYQEMEECRDMGLDVRTWIEKRLIDYISPSDVMYCDSNAPYEDFSAIARKTRCMMYPAMLPWHGIRQERRAERLPVTPDHQRALAMNYFGAGADGICYYNHFVTTEWAPFYPMQLSDCAEVRTPAQAAKGRRHYVFEPLWGGCDGFGLDAAPTGAIKTQRIVLSRDRLNETGRFRFRMCEDLSNVRMATLLFRAGHATLNDRLRVSINGHEIPAASIRRRDNELRVILDPIETTTDRGVKELKSGGLKAGDTVREVPLEHLTGTPGHPIIQPDIERPNVTCWFKLSTPPANYGDNWLVVALITSDPAGGKDIIIDEVEVFVA